VLMRFHEPSQAPSSAASPQKDSRLESVLRARTRWSVCVAALLGLLGGLAATTAQAQPCTTPSFATPSGSRIIPTGVVQPGHIAVGDFNRDGRLDFVVTDLANPNLEVFRQNPAPAPPGTWTSLGLVGTGGVATSVKVA